MKRKEELEIIVANLKEKQEKLHNEIYSEIPALQNKVEQAVRKLVLDNLGISMDNITFQISLGRGQVGISIKEATFGNVCDIRTKDDSWFDHRKKSQEEIMNLQHSFRTSHSSGGINQEEKKAEFYKEIIRGLIANELFKITFQSKDSIFFDTITQVLNERLYHEILEFNMSVEISPCETELSQIKTEERHEEIEAMAMDVIELGEPVNIYVRNSDNKRTQISSIQLVKKTDKKMRFKIIEKVYGFSQEAGKYDMIDDEKTVLLTHREGWGFIESVLMAKKENEETVNA
jgi:hypothetical protein